MLRLRYFAIFGLLAAFVMASAVAQEKKDPAKDPVKVDPKKEEPKKQEPKKEEPKKEEPKKDEPKKDEPKKDTPKAEAPALSWKFEAKKSFYQKMETTTEQNIKVMGLDVVQKQEQTFYFKWTPEEQDKESGNWKIKQEIEGIKMKIDIAGNPVSFDSTQENPPGGANTALSEFFKALKGSSFTLTFNPKTLKVEKVDGRKEFIDKLATANQQLQPLLSKILSDDALKQMADPTFGILPPPGKKLGETWDTTSTLNLGPIGTYTNKYKYTWKEQDAKNKDLELITVDTSLSYTAPTESDPALPFKIKSSNLTTKQEKDPNGKIYFNSKLGRLQTSDVKIELSGTITIEIGGNTTQVELTQKQTTSVETKDESLLPKPPMEKKP